MKTYYSVICPREIRALQVVPTLMSKGSCMLSIVREILYILGG